MNYNPQCGHMHLLTSYEWDTFVGILHCLNVSTILQDIILTQRNTKPYHLWVTFLKLEVTCI